MYMTEALAKYVADLHYEDIPQPTIVTAKKCIIDSIANLLYGRYTSTGLRILKYFEDYPVGDESANVTLVDYGTRPLDQVLMAHTVMARCADLDDGSRRAMGHPGCVLVPTALAVAEAYGKSGKDVLTALVAGYDIYIRTGSAINPSSYQGRGFESTGLCGAIAAAAVAAKLMDADAVQIKDALGLAALFCGGLIEYQNDGTMGKTLCGAWAAKTGLQAARLAKTGFTGPNAALEGKKGFMQAFSNAPCGDAVLKDLGIDFCINEVYFKQHACMRGLHSAIDAALTLREKCDLTPENIDSVIVWTTPFVQRLSNPTPQTPVGAQCSLQFTMATALKYGHLLEEKLLTASLEDNTVKELAIKIDCCLSEELQRYTQEHPSHWSAVCVEVKKIDGSSAKETVYLPNGEPERALSWNQLAEKLLRMTAKTPMLQIAEQMVSRIAHLDEFKSLSAFWK